MDHVRFRVLSDLTQDDLEKGVSVHSKRDLREIRTSFCFESISAASRYLTFSSIEHCERASVRSP